MSKTIPTQAECRAKMRIIGEAIRTIKGHHPFRLIHEALYLAVNHAVWNAQTADQIDRQITRLQNLVYTTRRLQEQRLDVFLKNSKDIDEQPETQL